MNDNVSKIKDRLGIVDVVSGYLKLQKAGANFKAPCPFHNEKTPSFFVSPERQVWKCFGCGKGGDIFTFIKEIEGVEFPEAIKILALRAGIELETFDHAINDSKNRLYQICELAARFFEKQLNYSNVGQQAVEYLKNRGLKEATINKFRLGFSPNTWDSLTKYLRNSGFTDKEIIDAGMAIKREPAAISHQPSAGIYDRFRSRIMFPVLDVNSRVAGFTGRLFETDQDNSQFTIHNSQMEVAKYINTPQTLIYDKSRILYGLSHSRSDIRKKDSCLLVEGNMDAIMSYQVGVTNVIASSGTALTPTHLSILKRYSNNLNFCFDNDSAGVLATKRGIAMALGQGFNVKIVSIDDKECKDPADYIIKYDKNSLNPSSQDNLGQNVIGWDNVVSKAKPIMEFYFDKAKEDYKPDSAESKKGFILAVAPYIKRLVSNVERSHWLTQLSYLLRVREDAIEADIMSAPDELAIYDQRPINKDVNPSHKSLIISSESPVNNDILNETLLSLVIKKPILFKGEIAEFDKNLLNPFVLQVFVELTRENLEQFNFSNFVKKFDNEKVLDLEFAYLKSQALWDGFKDDNLKAEFTNISNKLKQKIIHLHLTNLEYEIKAAEAVGDRTRIITLAEEFSELTKDLSATHKI